MGRRIPVTPQNSTNKHLCLGRIRLNAPIPSVAFANGGEETGFPALSGEAVVHVGGQEIDCAQYDALYLSRGSQIKVATKLATVPMD